MELVVEGIIENTPIDARYAFCALDGMGDNISPGLQWAGLPEGTASIAVSCVDPDAPTDATDVNVEGRTVPASLPRADFAHWLLVNIAADATGIDEGADASGITAKGKGPEAGPHGSVRGANDYTSWFEGDAEMEGTYHGYDGPCPPGNDELVHNYVFTVYALNVASIDLEPGYRLADFDAAIEGKVIDSVSVSATYTINPELS